MKLLDLFEYDPRIARATQQAAQGLGRAGQKLAEPLILRDIDGTMMQGIDKLEKEIAKYPGQAFATTFRNFLEKEKDAVKVTGKIGMEYENDKLLSNGKPNSAYIRRVLRKFYTELNKYLEKTQKQTSKDYFSKQKAYAFKPQI